MVAFGEAAILRRGFCRYQALPAAAGPATTLRVVPCQHRCAAHPIPTERRPKERTVQITRNSLDTNAGPSDWFTGTVYLDTVATPAGPSRVATVSR
jgi:hypothetical protein